MVLLGAIAVLVFVFSTFPPLTPAQRSKVGFDLSDSWGTAHNLTMVVAEYRDDHYLSVMAAFCAVYIFMQSFAIPGAIILSLMAGPLFGLRVGLTLVSAVATTGASMCYLLSHMWGRKLVQSTFPNLLAPLRARVVASRDNLFSYMLFLRITPLVPNWFINVSAPLLAVPLHTFVAATFLGLIPGNYIHITTALQLQALGEGSVSKRPFFILLGLGVVALLPSILKSRLAAMDAAVVSSASAAKPTNGHSTGKGSVASATTVYLLAATAVAPVAEAASLAAT